MTERKLPPTTVYLQPGQILTDEQRIELLAGALQTHYRKEFTKIEPGLRQAAAMQMARRLLEMANRCGRAHRVRDLANRMDLTAPTREECAAFDDMIKEVIVFRERSKEHKPPSRASRALRKAAGVTWAAMRESLGLPAVAPEEYTGSVTGPRG